MNRKREYGLTLIEVLVALSIVALVVVILLSKRLELVRAAPRTRDLRLAWIVAANKMGEILLEKKNFVSDNAGGSGDFEGYEGFTYDYEIAKEEVPTNDENDPKQKPKELLKVTLRVTIPDQAEDEKPLELVAYRRKEEAK